MWLNQDTILPSCFAPSHPFDLKQLSPKPCELEQQSDDTVGGSVSQANYVLPEQQPTHTATTLIFPEAEELAVRLHEEQFTPSGTVTLATCSFPVTATFPLSQLQLMLLFPLLTCLKGCSLTILSVPFYRAMYIWLIVKEHLTS